MDMGSEQCISITLISCEDLTCPNTGRSIKKNAMGVIRIPNTNKVMSTTVDKENGAFPRWNETFRVVPWFDIESRGHKTVDKNIHAQWFDIEIWIGNETLLGTARVPMSDFVHSLVPLGYLNCLSYRLRGKRGEFVNGIVNISVRVAYDQCFSGDHKKVRPVVQDQFGGGMEKGDCKDGCSGSAPTYGFGGKDHGGVVTGIPVSYAMNTKSWNP